MSKGTIHKAFTIAEKLGFKNELSYVLHKGKSNNAPYHNFYHTCCVMVAANDILMWGDPGNYQSIPEFRPVITAAIFHDINHSQGKVKDRFNVLNSIAAFDDFWYSEEDKSRGIQPVHLLSRDEIVDIILATEYPYTIPDDDLSYSQKVIRDADMSQIFTDNYFQQNVLGLAEEIGVDFDDFVRGQVSFLSNLKFHTPYAKANYLPLVDRKLEELELIKGFLY